jgi:hypothetical protein
MWLFSVLRALPNFCLCKTSFLKAGGLWNAFSGSAEKGLLYIFIAAILLILLFGLNRVKPIKKRAKK